MNKNQVVNLYSDSILDEKLSFNEVFRYEGSDSSLYVYYNESADNIDIVQINDDESTVVTLKNGAAQAFVEAIQKCKK